MRYIVSWNSKTWKEYMDRKEAMTIPIDEWLTEYEKWNRSFGNFSDFLQFAQTALKDTKSEKEVKKLLPAVSLLGTGQVRRLWIDNVELAAVEVEE